MPFEVLKRDALKEVNGPREFLYMRMLRLSLKCMGMWPGKNLKERNCAKYELVPAYFILIIKMCTCGLSILYLKMHHSSLTFFEAGHTYITIFMNLVTLSRLSTLPLRKKYRDVVKRFVTEIHLYYFRKDSVYAMKTHVKVHRKSYFFTIYLNFLLLVGWLLFSCSPMYKNYKNEKFNFNNNNNISYEFVMYYALPFDTATNLKGYIVVEIFNWFAGYICSSVFCILDLLLCIMVFHVCGHFRILIHDLTSFPKPANLSNKEKERNILKDAELYSHQEMIEVENKLIHCINYHRFLIKFTDEISEAFGPMLFINYIFHQVSGCVLLLEISQLKPAALVKYGPLSLVLFQQLIQLSYVIESIGTVTGQLKDAVYGVPWEHMDTKNRKTLMIFLINVQEPLHVNALGLAKVGVTSMAAVRVFFYNMRLIYMWYKWKRKILKTSLSYFAFLRSVTE